MIYEYRNYHCLPGKLPAIVKRFETVTVRLFKGMASSNWASGP